MTPARLSDLARRRVLTWLFPPEPAAEVPAAFCCERCGWEFWTANLDDHRRNVAAHDCET